MIYNRTNMTTSVVTISSILSDINNVSYSGLDISPNYQREFIWKREYKDSLILSIILRYPIGNIVVNQLDIKNDKGAKSELVDGKQRLMTINEFVENDYIIKGSIVQDIILTVINIMGTFIQDENILESLEKLQKKKKIKFKDLPSPIQQDFKSYNIPCYTMNSADSEQIREFFKVLQNQDKLKAGEIINSLPENKLSCYFDNVGYKLLDSLNYRSLNRAELEKIYYSIIGVLTKRLMLGANDKSIIKYVENIKEINHDEIAVILRMNKNLSYISNLSSTKGIKINSKRTLKYIILISGTEEMFFKDQTESKLQVLDDLSRKLAAFNSSETDEKAFEKYFGEEFISDPLKFKEENAERYRQIYQITIRSTKYDDVVIAINKLIDYINEKSEQIITQER